jgi:glycosyltransferase involved in cell wall biosynthesis
MTEASPARISIVTPCLNQAAHLGATLASVLDAQSPPDEYVFVDGGSTDGSIDVARPYEDRFAWWVSEPDDGQYAAIEKGFDHTTGEIMGWLNAGDLYMPWTLSVVRELFTTFPELEWLTTQRPMIADERGRVVACEFVGSYSPDSFNAWVNLPGGDWFARAGIQQESTFWRRSLWVRAGARLDTRLQLAGDFELWHRFGAHAAPYALDAPLAAHRVHPGQKTASLDEYVAEAGQVLEAAGRRRPGRTSTVLRTLIYHGLGRRPLRRLPSVARRPLLWSGALHATRTIIWREGEWKLADDFAL